MVHGFSTASYVSPEKHPRYPTVHLRVTLLAANMEQQQEIGGAQALLQLGTKIKEDEDDLNPSADDALAAPAHEVDNLIQEPKADPDDDYSDAKTTNQQINDAVEAAVMRYVGGTLDGGENTAKKASKRRTHTDDIMSNIQDYQWDRFLEEDVAGQQEQFETYESASLSTKLLPKRKKRRAGPVSYHDESQGEIDPELAGLDSTSEHDQLVHAAIMGAGELAKQLGSGTLSDQDVQHSLNHLPPHQAQQVLAAASAAAAGQTQTTELVAAINQLAQAASSLSRGLGKGRMAPPKTKKPMKKNLKSSTGGVVAIPSPLNGVGTAPVARRTEFAELTSVDALIQEASAQACDWMNNSNMHSATGGSGPRIFSEEEIAAVEHFISGYCHLHKLTREDICNRIWANERTKDNFWESLTKVLPYRSHASVYKHVRRQYHVFQVRGKWTKEDDELLAKLALTREGHWKEIGEMMGRMPEDCRDRWRNYVKCGENRALNKWTEDEEAKLREIVVEMITHAPPLKDRAVSINWTLVSEKMDGARSRIQCRYKWNKLLKRESIARVSLMDPSTKVWLFNKIQDFEFPNSESIDWDYIVHLFHEEHKQNHDGKRVEELLWTAADFKVGFEKMKTSIKDHRKLPLPVLLEKLTDGVYGNQVMMGPHSTNAFSKANNIKKQPLRAPTAKHEGSKKLLPLYNSTEKGVKGPDLQALVEDEATSIANAAVAAVSASVDEHDTQQQEYSLWR